MRGPTWIFDDSPIDDPLGHGERAVRFLRMLKHPKSRLPDNAFQLDPPFERIVRRIYGPVDEHGARLVRTVFLQIGKGSRKTSLAAGLSILHTYGPERVPRGANYVVAADKGMARVAFEEALGIIQTVPQLSGAARPVDSDNRLFHPKSGSFFEALSAEGNLAHARTPIFVLVDELWAHRKAALWQAIRNGVVKAPGGLIIIATTAGRGSDGPDYPMYEYAKRVASGEHVDPHFLPIIFEADPKAQWDSEETWHSVLPGLKYGYPDLPSLRQLAYEARERPSDRASFEQFFLGIRQSSSLAPYIDMAVYDEGADVAIDLEALKDKPCWLGVDLSSNIDLTVIVAAWKGEDDTYIVHPWFFCPRMNLQERQDKTEQPYIQWEKDEYITATDGNVVDFRAVEDKIADLCKTYDVREIAIDPHLARSLLNNLTDAGLPAVEKRQGAVSMMEPIKTLERAAIGRKLKHGGHPVLRYCFSNTEAERNKLGHLVRLSKPRKWLSIDGAVATVMAVASASEGGGGSFYESGSFTEEMMFA